MKNPGFLCFLSAFSLALNTGCITHQETVYRDVDRVKIEFENDSAARLFYERMHDSGESVRREEQTTTIDVPLIFDHKQKVVTGDNWLFNEAVRRCDTNKDGKITELEARIYSEQKSKRTH